jgi:adenylyltransferase/sulfurtransferase
MNAFPERYNRQINLRQFGQKAQEKLQSTKVLVVGAGGLGVPVLQYFAGMGVGTIGIVDGDVVSASNLNRQVLYAEQDVGKPKVEAAAEKLALQNSSITINTFYTNLTVENALDIVAGFDLVIDATDNFSARYLINDACVILNTPFVYGAIHEFEGHVSVFNYNNGPTYRCLYPDFPSAGEIPDCNTAGVLGVVPAIIGCQQALEAVKVITGIGEPASGYLQIFDFLNNDQYRIKLKAKPENKEIDQLKETYDPPPCASVPSIKAKELYRWLEEGRQLFLLDVRQPNEYKQAHLEKSHLIPLDKLAAEKGRIPADIPVVTFCEKGGRSLKAAALVAETRNNVYSLEGGLEQWMKEVGDKFVIS